MVAGGSCPPPFGNTTFGTAIGETAATVVGFVNLTNDVAWKTSLSRLAPSIPASLDGQTYREP